MTDGYRRLGLERNPFIAEQEPGVPDALWLDRPIAPPAAGEIVQLVGPRGSGKTSLLLRWQSSDPGPYVHVEEDRTRWRPPPLGSVVYWDEADRIPKLLLRRAIAGLAAGGGRAAIGTHRDLGRRLRHPDLELRTARLGRITGPDVEQWAATRIGAVTLGGSTPPRLDEATAARVAEASGGSWREVGDALHVWIARLARDDDSDA